MLNSTYNFFITLIIYATPHICDKVKLIVLLPFPFAAPFALPTQVKGREKELGQSSAAKHALVDFALFAEKINIFK